MKIALLLICAWFGSLSIASPALAGQKGSSTNPYRIYAITFRGMTDVEKGFQDYFKERKISVEITFRDLARDSTRMPGFLDEIRRTKPDLIYTWGTSVTLGVVGSYDKVDTAKHITNIPVLFTLVAAPVLAKISRDLKSSGRNVTGVYHVAPTEAQLRAMSNYRPFKSVGILYTPTEQNSLVTLKEIKDVGLKMGFSVVERPLRLDENKKATGDGAAELVKEIKQAKADWLYLPPDSFLGTLAQKVVIPAAMEEKLPTFASTEQLMEAGSLAGLVSRYYSIGQFTAYKAEQILVKKTPVGQIPIETLKRFSYQIQLSVARNLDLLPPLPIFSYAEFLPETHSLVEASVAQLSPSTAVSGNTTTPLAPQPQAVPSVSSGAPAPARQVLQK
jgi:putative ABC transport system substrate-binding protein